LTDDRSESLRPIFVIGNSRSGTTVMWNMLGRSPSVASVRETDFYESFAGPRSSDETLTREEAVRVWERLEQTQTRGLFYMVREQEEIEVAREMVDQHSLEGADPGRLYGAFLADRAVRGRGKPCEHTPRSVFTVDRMLEDFPEARVINMVRDPRDIMISQKNKWRRRWLGDGKMSLREMTTVMVNYHPISISLIWRGAIRAAIAVQEDPRVLFVRFEDMVGDPERTMSVVCDFIGIEYDQDLLQVSHTRSSVRTDAPDRKGLDAARSQGWRNGGLSTVERWFCQKLNQREMEAVGYEIERLRPNPLLILWNLLVLPFQTIAVLAVNRHRFKSLGHTIMTRLRLAR